jgi:hypothetical protein
MVEAIAAHCEQGNDMKDTNQAIADFGKAVTVLHTLIHKSVPLTNVQRALIKTGLHALEGALRTLPKETRSGYL